MILGAWWGLIGLPLGIIIAILDNKEKKDLKKKEEEEKLKQSILDKQEPVRMYDETPQNKKSKKNTKNPEQARTNSAINTALLGQSDDTNF